MSVLPPVSSLTRWQNNLYSFHATFAYSVADFGLVLTELCINDKENSSLKQLAAVLLRQYVDAHWSELSEKFTPPETPTHVSPSSLYDD